MEDYEISVQELSKRDADSYILIDIRDDSSYSYGNIPGSLHVQRISFRLIMKNIRTNL